MRTFVTFARKHGAATCEPVIGMEQPYTVHRAFWDKVMVMRDHPEFEHAVMWERKEVKKRTFNRPPVVAQTNESPVFYNQTETRKRK